MDYGASRSALKCAGRAEGLVMARETGHAPEATDRWLVHDLRQAVAAGLLLADPPRECSGESRDDLGQRMKTVRLLLESMMEMLAAHGAPAPHGRPLVDIGAAVGECVEAVSGGSDVPVTVVALAEAHAHGDGVLLRRAIRNVLDNAVRAAGDGGKVMVALTTSDSEALIEVTDDGAGFGDIPSGTGQGLAIVSQAMQAWRGTLEILSGPDPGTTVRLLVPCDAFVDRS
jgi:signal transduction histidine kinase